MVFTWAAAIFDCFKTLPEFLQKALRLDVSVKLASDYLPLFDKNLGWLLPSFIGLCIGLIIHFVKAKRR